jgi:Zn-dependent peptidase ImmA (M78 family)
MSIRRQHIRSLTEDLLRRFHIRNGPVPVDQIAASLGIVIQRSTFDGDTDMSGFLFRNKESGRAVIGVNASNSPRRQRFTIAHELGHFLLHEGDVVHVDRKVSLKLRNQRSSEGTDRDEKEANLFAAELLMPKRFLDKELHDIPGLDLLEDETLEELAHRYDVSQQSLAFRLTYLGYIEP